MKVEAMHGEIISTSQALQEIVFEYIELEYNQDRLHSTLGYVIPQDFELAAVA